MLLAALLYVTIPDSASPGCYETRSNRRAYRRIIR